jgi:hypothetical protein
VEGEPAGCPVAPVRHAWQRGGFVAGLKELVIGARAPTSAGDAQYALTQPFEPEQQQRAADDHAQHGYLGTGSKRRAQNEADGHNGNRGRERAGKRVTEPTRDADGENDRERLQQLDR